MGVKDESQVAEILNSLESFQGAAIHTGIIGEGGSYPNSKVTVLDVANFHEYGTSRAPERSFIRATYDKRIGDIDWYTTKVLTETVENTGSADGVLDTLGQLFADWTQEYLRDLSSPPNSPITIKMKGSSSPLIDTGQLLGSITYKVVR